MNRKKSTEESSYRRIEKIKELERKLAKYKNRLQRENDKVKSGSNSNFSLSHRQKPYEKWLGIKKVTPEVKRRLFVGFALEKQLKSNLKGVGPKNKVRQIMRKSIGSKMMKNYRTQR